MRKKLIAATFAGAILLGTALPFVGSTAFAANDNVPNAKACVNSQGAANANGSALANANGNSAVYCKA